MSNCVFGFPDWSQGTPLFTPIVAGGSWVSTLPASNAFDRKLSRFARSTDATTGATTMVFDLGVARSVGLMAVLLPNLTVSSTPTFNFGLGVSSGDGSLYDSGSVQARPTGMTIEDLIQPDGSRMNLWNVLMPTTPISARYAFLVISDTANADGHVDVARVIIAGAYRPSVCMQTGAKSQLEDDTVSSDTDGGATLFQARKTRRTDVFTLPNLGRTEALESIRKMQHRVGKSGQVFFVWDETDPYKYERAYLATMRSLGALEYPFSALYNSVAFEMAEVL